MNVELTDILTIIGTLGGFEAIKWGIVTVADKDAIKAARKALDDHNEYCDFIGNTVQKVTLTTALINAETAIRKRRTFCRTNRKASTGTG